MDELLRRFKMALTGYKYIAIAEGWKPKTEAQRGIEAANVDAINILYASGRKFVSVYRIDMTRNRGEDHATMTFIHYVIPSGAGYAKFDGKIKKSLNKDGSVRGSGR